MRPSLLSAVALSIVALYAMPAAAQVLDDASVEFEDQTMEDSTVVVASVTLPEGGFVVIHDDTLDDDAVGSVVGVSEYLEAGTHTDVNVTVQITTNGNGGNGGDGGNDTNEITLIAMPHQDTNDNQEYDFEDSDGQDDGPYTETVGGDAVTDEAQVTTDGQDGLDDGLDDPGGDDEDDGVVDGDEDTPGFQAVALLALLGAVAVLARRQ